MRNPEIQKMVTANPDAMFRLKLPRQADYYDRRTEAQDFIAKLHFHPKHGDLMATIVGRQYPYKQTPDTKPSKPIRIDSRHVVNLYEENQ